MKPIYTPSACEEKIDKFFHEYGVNHITDESTETEIKERNEILEEFKSFKVHK